MKNIKHILIMAVLLAFVSSPTILAQGKSKEKAKTEKRQAKSQ